MESTSSNQEEMKEAAERITEGLRILASMIVKKFISETKTTQASNNLSLIRKPLEVQDEKLTLSVQEVARLLGVSKSVFTVRMCLCGSGKIQEMSQVLLI
ncbi:MAG: hypothetical protein AAC993_04850 [Dehalococcoides mccartyi]|uniref:hypothetical protein n=1 Tax=Dehalococcoides mccartyi TaxID=61435 RepID=UPI0030FB7CDE